ncbi:MAG: hypothetical protein LBJ62_05330 [Bifidobacteriaceae bacterium]|jgi:hypothetical protein|nr:hypothetical protein [Bifidobacteriaceae bacterium]
MATEKNIPWFRLISAETRKTIDTRSALAVVLALGGLALAITIISVVAGIGLSDSDRPGSEFGAITTLGAAGVMMAMPIIGLLAMTSEWSQRTGGMTFLIEPRRWKVIVAKTAAAVVVAVALVTVMLLLGAMVAVITLTARGDPLTTSFLGQMVRAAYLQTILMTLIGLAWGSLLLSSPLAIVFVLLAPIVLDPLAVLVVGPQTAQWFMFSSAVSWIEGGSSFSLAVVTSFVLTCLAPWCFGLWRQTVREVR